jgi:hypothetical protein
VGYAANYFFFFAVVFLVVDFLFGFAFGFALALVFFCGIDFGAHRLLLLTATLPQLPQTYLNLRTLGAQTCLVSVSNAPQ